MAGSLQSAQAVPSFVLSPSPLLHPRNLLSTIVIIGTLLSANLPSSTSFLPTIPSRRHHTFQNNRRSTTNMPPHSTDSHIDKKPRQRLQQQASADTETDTSSSPMTTLAVEMKSRQSNESPLTPHELQNIITSISKLLPSDHNLDLTALQSLFERSCHLSHKDWDRTRANAAQLRDLLLPPSSSTTSSDNKIELTPVASALLERSLTEGRWEDAAAAASSRPSTLKPWAVLVTGVNGIRKTTSMYQDWFPELLAEALVPPPSLTTGDGVAKNELPTGCNSFFRQLDHLMAILTNEEFANLYRATAAVVESNEGVYPTDDYARLKDAIFTRYRTLAEMTGLVLVDAAASQGLNVMVETSGRDVAMFHYIDRFFPSDQYRHLALHFTIDDVGHAERSVDMRMEREMRDGVAAIAACGSGTVKDVVAVNAGGPYGSEVLKGVRKDSDRVWKDEVMTGAVGGDWYKATIAIHGGNGDEVWTARAIKEDGSEGKVFEFEKR